jgi:hypothetical protein
VHGHTALREPERDPPRSDREFERGAVAGEIRQEGDDRVDDGRIGLVGVPLVVPLRHTLAKMVLGHRHNLANLS